jgi:hypothetical protein
MANFREQIMESCKNQLKIHTEILLEDGMRKTEIEIELLHYLKKLLYSENH